MKVTQEDIDVWMKHPVTEEVFNMISALKDNAIDALGNGNTLNMDSMENTFGNTAHSVGYISGLDEILNVEGEDEDES